MPADVALEVRQGRLSFHGEASVHARNPIDVFLASLAADQGESAIGIILSGSGTDGSLGIKAIKEAGGLTMAQGADGSAPRHRGMPDSAIATGLVDVVLSAEQMTARLLDYAKRLEAGGTAIAETAEKEGLPEARSQICAILSKQLGHDFSGYKEKPFTRRITRRMQVLQLDTVQDYVDYLLHNPPEAKLLLRDLLIGVTNFFRDTSAFRALEELVLPRLFENKRQNDIIRVWVPGCSTGEEVYSLAILLREHINDHDAPQVQVFATDIDDAALTIARAGRYPASLAEGVSERRLQRFFVNDGGTYVISKQIRDMCIFSSHSVIRDPPFSRIDLISCRNLLIYLGQKLQGGGIRIFHYALRPGGYLFLGTSESLSQHGELFSPIDKKQRVFQRRDHVSAPVPVGVTLAADRNRKAAEQIEKTPSVHPTQNLRRVVDTRVIDRFAPVHVVVNQEGDVVYYSARTGKYLEPAAGMPNRQLVAMARRGLRLDLRAALNEAIEKRHTVLREHVSVDLEDRSQVIDLIIEPLPEFESDPLFLVLFQDIGPVIAPDQAAREPSVGMPEAVSTERLERELRDARERLQGMVEQYETALEELKSGNEELVSLNEELQSTNEELETSKEEIQSVNEELSTVNLELHRKVEELDRANADLRNLFDSTDVATIFLDREGVIRSFTPAVTNLFNLIPGDRGRPLTDIACDLEINNLTADIERVLHAQGPVARQVRSRDDGAHYLMRILPYWSSRQLLDGVVLTFVDVTQLAEAEAHQKTLVEELNHRVKNMLTVITVLANQTLARANTMDDFKQSFMGRIQAVGKTYGLVSRENWSNVALRALLQDGVLAYAEVESRVNFDGPQVWLRPKAALALGLVIHEMTTNATKHGALSVASGNISIAWRVEQEPAPGTLVIDWIETNGPEVPKSDHNGFGTELMKRELNYELGGKAEFRFVQQGLTATLSIPCEPELIVYGLG